MDLPLFVDLNLAIAGDSTADSDVDLFTLCPSPTAMVHPMDSTSLDSDDHKTDSESPVKGSFASRFGHNLRMGSVRKLLNKPPAQSTMDEFLAAAPLPKRVRDAKVLPTDSSVKRYEWWKSGLTILIVDDSLTNRKVLLRLLTSFG